MTKRFSIAALLLIKSCGVAFAHVGTSGFVLLLPSRFYMLGAALAVAASFLLLAFLPPKAAEWLLKEPKPLFRLPVLPIPLFSLFSFVLLLSFVVYGFTGPGDPFENPITLFIWIVWWIVFTLVQAVTGELWSLFNPWSGITWLMRLGKREARNLLTLPVGCGYWFAIVQFLAFAWLELVSTSAYDPETLATATALFWCFNFAGILLFGERRWLSEAEPFSVFFGLVGALSPFDRKTGEAGTTSISLVWPGKSLIKREALPLGGSLFVLLTLSTVSFDGFSSTFLWVSALGLNPLEFAGRSAVTLPMSIGLVAAFAILAGLFCLCVFGGKLLAGSDKDFQGLMGRLVYSILPISIVFQFAHYLTYLLVQGQYALKLASDPFGQGWDLFGTSDLQVTTSFFYGYGSVLAIWNTQTIAIVLGHIVGITMAHLIALDIFRDHRQAVRSQIFLAALMIAYTAFGLWLLSSPKVG